MTNNTISASRMPLRDGNGLRVQKISGGTTTVTIFSGGQDIAEYVGTLTPTSPTNEYVYAGSTQIMSVQGGTTRYLHNDLLSMRRVSGFVLANPERKKFRSYVNRLNRFSSPDPLGPGSVDTSNPQSWNAYSYVSSDPLDLVDPSGMFQSVPSGCTVSYPTPGQPGVLNCPPAAPFIPWWAFSLDFYPYEFQVESPPVIPRKTGKFTSLKKAIDAGCSRVPDAVSAGAGADVGVIAALGAQFSVTANGASGELTLSLSEGVSLGAVAPDAYLSASVTPHAPDNSFLDTHGQPSSSTAAGFGRAGYAGGDGTYGVTYGPSASPFTLAKQLQISRPLLTISYAGYAAYLERAVCRAITGH